MPSRRLAGSKEGQVKRTWERSVSIDDEGIPWAKAGVRADFIYVLFMHGYSVEELAEHLLEGFTTERQTVEDAIRYGHWAQRQKIRLKRTKP